MYKSIIKIFVFFVFLFITVSCAYMDKSFDNNQNTTVKILNKTFNKVNEKAVDDLLSNCIIHIDREKPIIVASLVDIDNMKNSSTLGRMASEMIAGRLSQNGHNVHELKMSQSNIFVNEDQGEFILSRNLHDIGKKHDVQGFVVGTYAIGEYHRYNNANVYISLRFVDIDNIIGCSVNYIVEETDADLWK